MFVSWPTCARIKGGSCAARSVSGLSLDYRHTLISWPSRTSVPSSSKLAATPSDVNSLLIHSAISMTCLRYAASPDTLGIATARDSLSTNCFSFAARYSVTFCGSEPVIVKEVREVWGMRESRSVSRGDQTERWILLVEHVLFFLLLSLFDLQIPTLARSIEARAVPCLLILLYLRHRGPYLRGA